MTNNDRQKFLSAGAIFVALAVAGFFLFIKPHTTYLNRDGIVVTSTPQDYKNFEVDIVTKINKMREGVGLKPLTIDPRLTDCAYQRNHIMYKEGWYGHILPHSTTSAVTPLCFPLVPEAKYIGEVLDGYWPSQAVPNWKNSPEHLKILLDPSATNIGFAYTSNGTVTHFKDPNTSDSYDLEGIAIAEIAQE